MSGSFSLKTIRIGITLGKGSLSLGGESKIIEGLACDVSVLKPGLPEQNSATVKIWGMKYEDMAQLSMLSFNPLESLHNIISIRAGEQGKELSLVYEGEIIKVSADFNQAPDPCMQIEACSGSYPQEKAMHQVSVEGQAPADQLFAQFTEVAGYGYKNLGVTSSVNNGVYSGSPMDKIIKLARDIGCELIVDDSTVIVAPPGHPRDINLTLLNKDTGLIGYPVFNQSGISCRCIFNPNIVYGGLILVQSIVPRVSGLWKITKLSHHLSAYTPSNGSWESQLEAVYYG